MAKFDIAGVKIAGIAAAVPKTVVENEHLPFFTDTQFQTFANTVGIKTRRTAQAELPVSAICIKAATKLLDNLKWAASEIDLLIFVTQTPDYKIPGPATMVHHQLGMKREAPALDLNMGCSGYIYSLSVIASMLSAGQMNKALLLIGDTMSHLIDKNNPSLVPLFSDAGTATALLADSSGKMAFNLQVNGAEYDAISTKNKSKPSDSAFMKMDGLKIFNFGLTEIAQNILKTMEWKQYKECDIDFLLLHQANKLLLERIRSKAGFPKEKVPLSISKYGNTSNASIPLTIVTELADTAKFSRLNVALTGFGVGLTWGTLLTTLDHIICPELIEI